MDTGEASALQSDEETSQGVETIKSLANAVSDFVEMVDEGGSDSHDSDSIDEVGNENESTSSFRSEQNNIAEAATQFVEQMDEGETLEEASALGEEKHGTVSDKRTPNAVKFADFASKRLHSFAAVSYTHLTLPTILRV